MGLLSLHSEYADLLDMIDKNVFQQFEVVAAHGDQPEQERPANSFALRLIVSDSIILVSHDVADVAAISRFVMASILVMEEFFTAHFPLRGAIAAGDVLHDDARNILLSPIIPDIVSAEKVQEWTGCHILESAEPVVAQALGGERFVERGMPAEARLPIIPYRVPVKNGAPDLGTRLCLNWPYLLGDDQLAHGMAFLQEPKREQTDRFVRTVFSLPSQAQMLPAEYAPARYVRMRVTRSQMMPRFFNAEHRHEPLPGRQIAWEAWEE